MNNRKIFTSESVTQGHPDKLCDLISDSVLDAVLAQDPMGRVACETAATTGMVLVMGEITTSAQIDIASLARKAICDAGYDRPEMGFDGHSCNVMVAVGHQSPDIATGVDNAYDDGSTGAGDPGKITPKLVTDCAKAGDAAAKAVFDTYIEHLSSACASVYNILDPEVLAIGGGLSAAGPFLFDPLQEKVSKKCFYATRGKLVPAVLGNEAGMVGAALLARDAKV